MRMQCFLYTRTTIFFGRCKCFSLYFYSFSVFCRLKAELLDKLTSQTVTAGKKKLEYVNQKASLNPRALKILPLSNLWLHLVIKLNSIWVLYLSPLLLCTYSDEGWAGSFHAINFSLYINQPFSTRNNSCLPVLENKEYVLAIECVLPWPNPKTLSQCQPTTFH